MLSDLARPVVEATLPLVDSRLEEIVMRTRRKTLAAHPDLLGGGVERGNKANSEPCEALLGAIAAFARHVVEKPDSLPEAVLAQIAHPQTPIGIAEDQCRIMYPYLFEAISEEIGSWLTPDVGAAWSEVYWLMVDALIRIEEGTHAPQANAAWDPWRVIEKKTAGASTVTFVLEPASATPLSASMAGQFVSVRVPEADGTMHAHRYALSPAARTAERCVFSTEYNDGSEVSRILHEKIQVGDVVELSNPRCGVHLQDSKRPLILASAAGGCSTSASLLRSLAKAGSSREVIVLHAERRLDAWALGDQMLGDIDKIGDAELHLWLEEPAGRPVADAIAAHEGVMSLSEIELPEDADVYVCGPLPFMQKIRSEAISLAIPAQRIHYEVFDPEHWGASAS